MKVPIEISARHIHLSQIDLDYLFGKGYNLHVLKSISQPGQFAAKETVTLKNNGKIINNVRIVGPVRDFTQVEISKTDTYLLNMEAPIRISGNIDNTPGIVVIGLKNTLQLKKGLIIAKRHLHVSPYEAKKYNLFNGQEISVTIRGVRSVIFNQVAVRSRAGQDKLAMHLDTDEGNAACLGNGNTGEII